MRILTISLLFAAACSSPSQRTVEPINALPSRPAQAEAQPASEARFSEARALLSARHTDDLPAASALSAAGGAEALTWLAQNDDSLVVRERALTALAEQEGGSATCEAELANPSHDKLVAAALRCLAGTESELGAERARALLDSSDPRVGLAAADLLLARPAEREALEARVGSEALAPLVRDHLSEQLHR